MSRIVLVSMHFSSLSFLIGFKNSNEDASKLSNYASCAGAEG